MTSRTLAPVRAGEMPDELCEQPRPRADAVTALSIYVAILVGVPSVLVVGPLGGAGSPAQLIGLAVLLAWGTYRLSAQTARSHVAQPVRRVALAFGASVLASYIVATTRAIDGVELRAADRGILNVCAWLGIMFLAMDCIPSRARLDVLLRRLVAAGGALASLGVVQSVTGMAFTNYIQIPGLSANNSLLAVSNRDGVVRAAGTAMHPIEFGVVLTMVLPFAIHYATNDRDRRWLRRWYPVLAICLAIPVSVSRSAVIGTAVVLIVLLPSWPRERRLRAYAAIVGAIPCVYALSPGLLGTLKGLFTGIGNDSSALSRTGSYDLAANFIARSPILGRGFSTFLPEYRILDNQYLGTVIELGIVGLTALLLLFVMGFTTARNTRRVAADQKQRDLAQCCAAAIAAAAVSFAFFDTLSFPMAAGLVFFTLGIASALRRLVTEGDVHVPGAEG